MLGRFFRSKPPLDPTPSPAPSSSSEIEGIVRQIAHHAVGLGKESAELNGSINELARMNKEQAQTFKVLANDIEAMVQANREIGEITTASGRSVAHARKVVERVGHGVGSVLETLRDVASAASEIERIAVHTRLVAFNASVEAKHAGDKGKGFSTVADAVKDLAAKVEQSSKLIMGTLSELDTRAKALMQGIKAERQPVTLSEGGKTETFHAAVSRVEAGVAHIAEVAQQNLDGCAHLIASVQSVAAEVEACTHTFGSASARTQSVMNLSLHLIEMAADSGVSTEETPYIKVALEAAHHISQVFEEAIRDKTLSKEELFDHEYRPVPDTDPQQYVTHYLAFADRVLTPIQEKILADHPKLAYAVAVDVNGYLPTHNLKFTQPQGSDPVWNEAHCRQRRIYNDRTGLTAARNRRKFLLQTYQRTLGDHKLLMKELSAPIHVNGEHWGAVRMGYPF